MFAIFKSANQPKPAEKPTEAGPHGADRDTPGPAEVVEQRPSSASIPTIHGHSLDVPQTPVQPHAVPLPESPNPVASLAPPPAATAQGASPSIHTQSSSQSDQPGMRSQSQSALPLSPPTKVRRRFSFPSFSFLRSDAKQNKASASLPLQTQDAAVSRPSNTKSKTGRGLSGLIVGTGAASEKRAKESAVVVRSIIMGNHNLPPNNTKTPSKSDIARVKAQLLEPKTAAKVIAHLKTLPPHPEDPTAYTSPIHAVCLDVPDTDVHDNHFAQLRSIATASVSAASAALADLHLIDLITAPNMGFGAPVTAQGLFAGAVPTAETVIEGIEQITPQLMALGFATGKAIVPDHKGVIVPVDRISALTYWWGFEICLPPPTMAHLEVAEDPASTLLNLLSALALLNEGVREILPFIRYIAQFVQSEWGLIKRADEGKGVVCTATWLLPVALVPRPWDFPDPPPHTEPAGQSRPTSPSVQRFSASPATPKPSSEVPNNSLPRASSALSAETKGEDESRPAISSQPPVLPELVVTSPGSIDGARRGGTSEQAHRMVQHGGEPTAH